MKAKCELTLNGVHARRERDGVHGNIFFRSKVRSGKAQKKLFNTNVAIFGLAGWKRVLDITSRFNVTKDQYRYRVKVIQLLRGQWALFKWNRFHC